MNVEICSKTQLQPCTVLWHTAPLLNKRKMVLVKQIVFMYGVRQKWSKLGSLGEQPTITY